MFGHTRQRRLIGSPGALRVALALGVKAFLDQLRRLLGGCRYAWLHANRPCTRRFAVKNIE